VPRVPKAPRRSIRLFVFARGHPGREPRVGSESVRDFSRPIRKLSETPYPVVRGWGFRRADASEDGVRERHLPRCKKAPLDANTHKRTRTHHQNRHAALLMVRPLAPSPHGTNRTSLCYARPYLWGASPDGACSSIAGCAEGRNAHGRWRSAVMPQHSDLFLREAVLRRRVLRHVNSSSSAPRVSRGISRAPGVVTLRKRSWAGMFRLSNWQASLPDDDGIGSAARGPASTGCLAPS